MRVRAFKNFAEVFMKRLAIGFALLLSAVAGVFAQNDFQPLAVVKLNKSETITLKQLKTRANFVLTQYKPYGIKELTSDQKKQILENLIDEKLITQAAAKEGMSVTDSQVTSAFLNTFSQQLGTSVTEAQLEDLIKQRTGLTLDGYLKENSGMGTAEYKAYLKNQLIAQQYVYTKKQNELQKVAATDDEIRNAYEMNKSTFVWNDMLKLFLVIVPAGDDKVAARALATDLRNQYVKDNKQGSKMKVSEDNGKKYRAGDLTVAKTAQQAQQLGWSYDKIIELFGKDIEFVSEITETDTDFQFYAVLKKFDAKMLALSDVVQPETTVTVYDYIKQNLTSQKQSQYFSESVQKIAEELDTPENVERKKTGDDLVKLLNW